jgi:hypothetical protein
MAFTETDLMEHLRVLEAEFWSKRRPPLHLRELVREGQRIEGQTIDLFLVRAKGTKKGGAVECPIVRLRYVRSRREWQIFWQRANGKWCSYPPEPTAPTLSAALAIVNEDDHGCFFG